MKTLWQDHKGVILTFLIGLLVVIGVCLLIISYSTKMDKEAVQLISSAVIGWGALFGIIVAAERNRELNRQATAALLQAEATLQQAVAAEKQQASEQLIEAIKLLAQSDKEENPSIEVRIGALYGLEALANTHPMDYGAQIIKTIAAYIYDNAQKTARDKPGKPEERKAASPLGKDVQTAFAVLKSLYDKYAHDLIEQGKLRRFDDKSPTRLDDIDFSVADFRMLNLMGVEWIERPMLIGAKLQGTLLYNAQLKGAYLWMARLQRADLQGAELQGADLWGAKLQKTDLQNTHLQGAGLDRVQLQETKLGGAYLDYSRWHDAKVEDTDKKFWQPQSAQIFCDDGFPPLGYGHKPTQRLDPNDTKHNWQKGWAGVLQAIPTSVRHEVVTTLFFNSYEQTKDTLSLRGLLDAIKALEDYKTLKGKLSEDLQKILDT